MAIDIRATVTCSLGTLISGSISDDYVQGSGLIKTRGSVEISGTITPAVGTAVTFSYTKSGVARSIPRKLRVMSSFADPFRRTTTVELGCKLTYLSDLKEPIDWTAFDDPQNSGYVANDALIVTLPLYASSVMNKCLSELGITASSNPLTNKFSIAEFDFGAGYVPVLSDLLVSESYCGYLDTNEVLQVFNLDQDAGTGPVFTGSDIVDLGPIGVGQLPGEAVTVSYSTLKLKNPDSTNNSSDPWIYTVSRGVQQSIKVATGTYTYIPETVTETQYEAGGDRRILKQTVTKTTIAAEAGGSYLEAVFNELGSFPVSPGAEITEVTTTTYEYDIAAITVQLPNGSWYYTSGEVQRTTTLIKESVLRVIASFNLPWVVESSAYAATTDTMVSRKTVRIDETVSGYTRSISNNYAIYGYTQEGQQLIALAGQGITTLSGLNGYVSSLLSTGALIFTDTSVEINYGDSRLNNRLPPVEDVNNAAYAKGGDPNNGWRTESFADLELALGSATAQRRIEFSMPYAPDDTFSGPTGGPFTATPSDAPAKAMRYGRVQNRLLLGNRNGVNLQLAPEKLPAAPYSPLYLQASGLTALYRANGTNWAFDSNGIVCSVDALFWAAVGGTGTFWFPVAPGITTLPVEPPIVDGAMNAGSTVLPYNETAVYTAVVRTTLDITSINYALAVLTEIPALVLKTKVLVKILTPIYVPVTAITLVPRTPTVKTDTSVAVPAAGIAVAMLAPTISSGVNVTPTAFDFSVNAFEPVFVGEAGAVVAIPEAEISIATHIPTINAGTLISVPVTDCSVAAYTPIVWREPPYFVDYSQSFSTAGFALPWPLGHQTNDIGLVVIESSGADSTMTPPSGWQALSVSPVVDVASISGSKLQLWWRRATSNAEADILIPDGGDHQIAAISTFRGCPTTGNPWDVLGSGTKTSASATATVPSVTATVFNTRVVMFVGRPDDSSSTAHFGVPVNAALTDITKHFEYGSSAGNGGGFVVASGLMDNSGATGTSTLTKTVSTTDTYFVVALKGV
jgi:hypothetical protein